MITQADFHRILFLDIETVPCQEHYSALDSRLKALWDKKSTAWKDKDFRLSHLRNEDLFCSRAGLYADSEKL